LSSITVSSDVENYRQLKADLVSLSGVAIMSKRQGPVLAKVVLVMIPTFAFLVVSFLATSRLIAAIASFTLAAMMFKAKMFEHRRPGAAKEAKSVFVWSTSIAIVFVIRGMYLLMF